MKEAKGRNGMGPNFPHSHPEAGGPLCGGPQVEPHWNSSLVTGKVPLCTEKPEGENKMYRAGFLQSMKGQRDAMKQSLCPDQPKAIFCRLCRPGSFWNSPHSSSLREELGRGRGEVDQCH